LEGPLINVKELFFFNRATSKGGTLSIRSTSPAKSAAILDGPDLIGLKSTLSNDG
jgi:hypothetical protein